MTALLGLRFALDFLTYRPLLALRTFPPELECLAMPTPLIEEPHIERVRRLIEDQYDGHSTGCGTSFGELLCYEIHTRGMTFAWLAEKWGVSLPTLGELIWDHCRRLELEPTVNHNYVIR